MARSTRRGPWLPEEDAQLIELISTQGASNWVRISQQLRHRSAKQCRERYHQNLKSSLNHEPISIQEGERIEQMVAEMGKRWAEIARRLGNRSDNAVKNWWSGNVNRRKRGSSRTSDRSYNVPLPLANHSEHDRYHDLQIQDHTSQHGPMLYLPPPPSLIIAHSDVVLSQRHQQSHANLSLVYKRDLSDRPRPPPLMLPNISRIRQDTEVGSTLCHSSLLSTRSEVPQLDIHRYEVSPITVLSCRKRSFPITTLPVNLLAPSTAGHSSSPEHNCTSSLFDPRIWHYTNLYGDDISTVDPPLSTFTGEISYSALREDLRRQDHDEVDIRSCGQRKQSQYKKMDVQNLIE